METTKTTKITKITKRRKANKERTTYWFDVSMQVSEIVNVFDRLFARVSKERKGISVLLLPPPK